MQFNYDKFDTSNDGYSKHLEDHNHLSFMNNMLSELITNHQDIANELLLVTVEENATVSTEDQNIIFSLTNMDDFDEEQDDFAKFYDSLTNGEPVSPEIAKTFKILQNSLAALLSMTEDDINEYVLEAAAPEVATTTDAAPTATVVEDAAPEVATTTDAAPTATVVEPSIRTLLSKSKKEIEDTFLKGVHDEHADHIASINSQYPIPAEILERASSFVSSSVTPELVENMKKLQAEMSEEAFGEYVETFVAAPIESKFITCLTAYSTIQASKAGATVTVSSKVEAKEIDDQGGLVEVARTVSLQDSNTVSNVIHQNNIQANNMIVKRGWC